MRLIIDLSNEYDVVSLFLFKPDEKLLVVSSAGRGFIVKTDDVFAQTRTGKQVLILKSEDEAKASCNVDGDHIAVIGENRKLLLFPVAEVPTMTKGRGVIMQRYNNGGLADVKTFNLDDGLNWQTGERRRTETNLIAWLGKRAQVGRLPPKGFSRTNRFS